MITSWTQGPKNNFKNMFFDFVTSLGLRPYYHVLGLVRLEGQDLKNMVLDVDLMQSPGTYCQGHSLESAWSLNLRPFLHGLGP